MFECPHRCVLWSILHWISNHHHHMCVMKMIWSIPLFLSHLLNNHPDIHRVPPLAGLLSQTFTFWPEPWPWMEISFTLGHRCASKEKKIKDWRKENKINQSKNEEKQKKIEKKREKEHTKLRGSPWSRLHPREGKRKAFLIMVAVYKWKLISEKYRASLPYIGRGQKQKK